MHNTRSHLFLVMQARHPVPIQGSGDEMRTRSSSHASEAHSDVNIDKRYFPHRKWSQAGSYRHMAANID